MATLSKLRQVAGSAGGVLTALVLSAVYLYSVTQPSGGYIRSDATPSGRSRIRSWLATSSPARRLMRFHMRDGSYVRSRIVDCGGLLSVHVDRDYDMPWVDWTEVRTIVDIGAHVGSFTLWAAKRAPNAHFIAVEPNPETFALLTDNINDNRLRGRVTLVNAAVADVAGMVHLQLIEHSLGTRIAETGSNSIRVRAQTIAGLLAEVGMQEVNVLKIDCEGMEYAVFKAMDKDWLRRIDTLACEYHPEPAHDVSELDAVLRAAGFIVQRPDAPLGVLWATR